MRKLVLLVLTLSLLLVGGCWDQLIIEELAMAYAIGFDTDPTDPQLFILTTTNPTFSESSKDETKKLVGKGYSLSNAFFNMQRQRDRILVLGQVATLVFSEDAARKGLLHQIMREVDQQRDINPNAKIVIVRGSEAREVIFLEPVEEAWVARFLSDLLDHNFNSGIVPRITVSRYWVSYSTAGVVPVVPVIELTGSDDEKIGVNIVGLAALDSTGRMQGILTDQETTHFMLLTGQNRRGRATTKLPIDGALRDTSGFIKNVSRHVTTSIVDGKARIAIKLKVSVDIINIDWDTDVTQPGIDEKVEKALARDIQGNALEMLRKTQDWGTDVVGLGQYVRIQNPQWFRGKNWDEEYKKSEISLEVVVEVKRLGALVNPQY